MHAGKSFHPPLVLLHVIYFYSLLYVLNFHLLPGGIHCIYLKPRDRKSANHVWCSRYITKPYKISSGFRSISWIFKMHTFGSCFVKGNFLFRGVSNCQIYISHASVLALGLVLGLAQVF